MRFVSEYIGSIDFVTCRTAHMSLGAASESRKERLEALRRRKEGGEADGYVYMFAFPQDAASVSDRSV